jgi:hypothetical protein
MFCVFTEKKNIKLWIILDRSQIFLLILKMYFLNMFFVSNASALDDHLLEMLFYLQTLSTGILWP